MLVEGPRSLLGYDWFIRFVLRQDAAGKFIVVERLLTRHPRVLCRDKVGFGLGCYVSGQLPLGVQFGAALGGRYALYAARMGKLLPIGDEPAFAVRGRANE